MTDNQIARLNGLAEKIRVAQLGVSSEVDIGATVLDSGLKAPIEWLARIIGAREGAKLGKGGSSIVTANIGSTLLRRRIEKLTASKAEMLLKQAVNDGELYRALLVGPTASKSSQEKALDVIDKAINRLQQNIIPMSGIAATPEEQQ
jgi:hypothetical protein